jgi:lipoprotein-anchoring transpeptidase ErfK/SrfK
MNWKRNFTKILLSWLLLAGAAWALPNAMGRDVLHEVQEGEDLYTIARKYALAPDHIMWANDVSFKYPPRPGDQLLIPLRRIPPAARDNGTSIVLNLPERILYLYRGGRVVKYWGVAIGGEQSQTPQGSFAIMSKEVDPTWYPPKAATATKPVPPGPDNPLGDRWMQITPNMVGIHGTNDPDSIGGVTSLGCIRLYPEAVHELYDQVSVGTRVHIIYEQVRLGKEPDGTLVWTFFPDPYSQWFTAIQAQDELAQARAEGYEIALTDFEIEEALRQKFGVLHPVFGQPVELRVGERSSKDLAYVKATGNWLDAGVLEGRGYKVTTDQKSKTVRIESADGKVVVVKPEKLPLNPLRVPHNVGGGPFQVDGHKWKGKTWVPFPLVLDYFAIPYQWDSKTAVLQLEDVAPR